MGDAVVSRLAPILSRHFFKRRNAAKHATDNNCMQEHNDRRLVKTLYFIFIVESDRPFNQILDNF